MDMNDLMSLYFDDAELMSEEQLGALSDWIREDPEHAKVYLRASFLHQLIHRHFRANDAYQNVLQGKALEGSDIDPDESLFDLALWQTLSLEEKMSPKVEVKVPADEGEQLPIRKAEVEKSRGRVNKFSLVTAVMSLAALLMMLVYVHFNAPVVSEEVATLSDFMKVKWLGPSLPMKTGARLSTGQGSVYLLDGYVKIHYDEGVDVVIEGPAEFELMTATELNLKFGRVFARVSETGKGFTIQTENSRVIDLGTEFGVQANIDGSTELHVYKGNTMLVAGRRKAEKSLLEVPAGDGRHIAKGTAEVKMIALDERGFVRNINSGGACLWRGEKYIDLADIVGFGNGFDTGVSGRALNPMTQQIGELQSGDAVGDNQYHRIESSPFIDGVFVPDGGAGAIQITSAGHVFDSCPDTNGRFYNGPVNGRMNVHEDEDQTRVVLGGIEYGRVGRPSLTLHSNLGITFDLKQITANLPEYAKLTGFESLLGISEDADFAAYGLADVWIFIDGQIVFEKKGVRVNHVSTVNFDIPAGAEFLTLIVTEGDLIDQKIKDEMYIRDTHGDWCVFALPRLFFDDK